MHQTFIGVHFSGSKEIDEKSSLGGKIEHLGTLVKYSQKPK
jgi:hypothetical protein